MSATATDDRLPLAEAEEIAERFIFQLGGAAERISIAGSIRRRLPTVGDIELVAVPTRYTRLDLFGESAEEVDLLDERLCELERDGVVQRRRSPNGAPLGWGPKAKFLVFEGTAIDLFSPEAARFGWILALRTGPSEYANALVTTVGHQTKAGRRGLLPAYLAARDGWLTYRASAERIPTPEEADVFRLFDLPHDDPWERT